MNDIISFNKFDNNWKSDKILEKPNENSFARKSDYNLGKLYSDDI